MRIGSLRNTNAKYYSDLPLIWTDGPIWIPELLCSGDTKLLIETNFTGTLSKSENILRIWAKRSLTILSKILIVNTLIIPLFLYRLVIINTLSKAQFAQFKKLITNLLWEGKQPRIAYKKLIHNFDQAVLRLVDLETKEKALKVKLIQVARLKPDLLWSQWMIQKLPIELEYFLGCNMKAKDIQKKLPHGIISDVLTAWSSINYSTPSDAEEILQQNIWFNSHIKNQDRVLFYKMWYKKGIQQIAHFIQKDGTFYTCEYLQKKFGREINFLDLH